MENLREAAIAELRNMVMKHAAKQYATLGGSVYEDSLRLSCSKDWVFYVNMEYPTGGTIHRVIRISDRSFLFWDLDGYNTRFAGSCGQPTTAMEAVQTVVAAYKPTAEVEIRIVSAIMQGEYAKCHDTSVYLIHKNEFYEEPITEVTMEQVCEKFGYPVKIVRG